MKADYTVFCLCAFICHFWIPRVSGHVYTGIYHLEKLLQEENKLVNGLGKFIKSEKDANNTVSSDVEIFYTFVKEANTAAMNDETHVEHPINAFHLIHRVITKWSSIFDEAWWNSILVSEHAREFNEMLHYSRQSGFWPSNEDVSGAAIALLRLWKCYQLDLFQLFAGNISGVQATPLSCNDVITICKLAHEANMHYDVIIWLEKYIEYTGMTLLSNKTEYLDISRLLAKAYEKYGMPWKSLEILEPLLLQGDADIQITHRSIKEVCENLRPEDKNKVLVDEENAFIKKYYFLCGSDLKTPSEKSALKCFLRKTKIPLYWAKEEVVNNEPRVSLFYDVTSDKEMAFLREVAKQTLRRSQVSRDDGKTMATTTVTRISSSAWLTDVNNVVLRTLDRRVGIITGLNTEFKSEYSEVEQFLTSHKIGRLLPVNESIGHLTSSRQRVKQCLYEVAKLKKYPRVLNYGIGGMYRPHYDFLGIAQWRPPYEYDIQQLKGSGDRIATWIFYLSDVKQGGATVFPYLNTRIPATKGAAAFWFNLKPSGETDPRTVHAACPVLMGSKWVCNKWIREWGQFNTRPCGLSKNATDNHPIG